MILSSCEDREGKRKKHLDDTLASFNILRSFTEGRSNHIVNSLLDGRRVSESTKDCVKFFFTLITGNITDNLQRKF